MLKNLAHFCATFVLISGILAPGTTLAQETRSIVIEGVGGSLTAYLLAPAIEKTKVLQNENYKVYFYGTELCSDGLSDNGQQAINKLTNMGMQFIDKSSPEDLRLYQSLTPDYVFLATPPNTHIPLVKMWLSRNYPPKKILVEKPFTENLDELEEFVAYLNANPGLKERVCSFDLAEVSVGLHGARLQQITKHLSSIDEITVYWLQNNSGEITNNSYLLDNDDRPISRENRVALLREGILFDQLIHLFPAIHNIVDLNSIDITDIKVAQYENAEIMADTFIASRMLIKNRQTDKKIPVTMYAGKGVGEISSLNINRNLKHFLLLHNKSGKRVLLDLDKSIGVFIDKDGNRLDSFDLPKNYYTVVENLFLRDPAMGEPVESALTYLHVLMDMKEKISKYLKTNTYPTYRVGTKSSPAPSLEELLLNCKRAYGSDNDKLRNVSIDYTG